MKKALLILALGLVTASGAFAQGEIVFANFNSGVNSPITDTTGARLNAGAGANGFYADLFYGAPGSTDAQLTDLGIAVPFSTGGGAGYFLGGGRTLPGQSGNTELEVRVWQVSAGATWAAATGGGVGTAATYQGHGGTQWGVSVPITLNLPVAPTPSPDMTGLTAFQLTPVAPVPEPTTLALCGLGAAALLLFRRRKN